MRFYMERVEASRNFANKVWNASRFIMMNLEKAEVPGEMPKDQLTAADKWILSKVNTLAKEVTENMDKYELGIAVQKVYDFIWEEFCDWYIEMVKPRLYNSDDTASQNAALWTLKTVLVDALKLLHPYMPFITEEIFCTIQSEEESIMISKWPEYSEARNFASEEKAIEIIKEAVRGIRNVRTEMNVAPSKKAHVYVVSEKEDIRKTFEEGRLFFATLSYASDVSVQTDKNGIADDAVSVVIANANIYIPFAELVDIKQEIERLVGALAEVKRRFQKKGTWMQVPEYLSPHVVVTPRDAFYALKESLPIAETKGRVCSEFVMCYPPGIPILAPGEEITEDILKYIEYAREKGCSLTGSEDPDVQRLNVVNENTLDWM